MPNVDRVHAASAEPLEAATEAADALRDVRQEHLDAAETTAWNWRAVCLAMVGVSITLAGLWGLWAVAAVAVAAAVALFVLTLRGSAAWPNLRQCLVTGWLSLGVLVLRVRLGIKVAEWGRELRQRGMGPVVDRSIRTLLGGDPDSLLVPDSYDGLRSPRERGYVVESAPALLLKRKLAQIQSGTIAVCGPRGAGKTTLLETCVEDADFGLLAQAPATYAPHDFLLSLSVQLCEKYVEVEGYDVPEFTRLSHVRRLLRRIWARCRKLLRWSVFALPTLAFVVLGSAAAVRSVPPERTAAAFTRLDRHVEEIGALIKETWQGQAAGTSVSLLLIAAFWWRMRRAARWHFLRRTALASGAAVGIFLCLGSLVSTLADKGVQQRIAELSPEVSLHVLAYLGLWAICRKAGEKGWRLPVGGARIAARNLFGPLSKVWLFLLLIFILRNPQTQAVLADADNPLRVAAVLIGVILLKVSDWELRPAEPALVTQCRNHLYRLQTIQMSTAAMTTGAAQVLTLGTAHTTSVSTVPPNFPELVTDFRELLSHIAATYRNRGGRVVIAIDEVDRLGSDTQALAFLSEIKAVLGVPHVHYLISVAEDVGAAFVRRGLPHRDVTDSSLDDVVYVQPATLDESRAILARRAPGLSDPYVMLAHALSGGIPRDLLRYGRHIMETQEKTQSAELTDISRGLVLQELAETLAGFRTLLSKQQWTPDTHDILNAFRNLGAHLRGACPCTELEIQFALEQFAVHSANDLRSTAHPALTDDARQLIDEAAAYAYFSLTLLDIFAAEGFDRRRQAAETHGPNGDPELLAEARQELGLSPYSARPLISAIREAWSLPLQPALAGGAVPPPRSRRCDHHPHLL
ncbi:P-loop NTPase fold protein [Streptomyces macrosporus]